MQSTSSDPTSLARYSVQSGFAYSQGNLSDSTVMFNIVLLEGNATLFTSKELYPDNNALNEISQEKLKLGTISMFVKLALDSHLTKS